MSFEIPTKYILSSDQLEDFQNSQTHADIVTFIEQLNESVISVKLTDDVEVTVRSLFFVLKSAAEARHTAQEQRIDSILNILEQVQSIASQTPPVDNKASRFGNPAFRTFHDKVEQVSHLLHRPPGTRKDNNLASSYPPRRTRRA